MWQTSVMTMTPALNNKTVFITGGSRGIGLAIGVRAAQDGANVVIAAKTSRPHPKLPGTIHSAVEAIEAAGGQGLAIQLDIRDEHAVADAMAQANAHFGGIDMQKQARRCRTMRLMAFPRSTVRKAEVP